MQSPHTVAMVATSDDILAGERRDGGFNLEHKIPNIHVASPMITGYCDLGEFLLTQAWRFLSPERKSEYEAIKRKIVEIDSAVRTAGSVTDVDKIAKLVELKNIYSLLPSYCKHEIEKAFGASKFIGNWDFANLSLANIGCRFRLDKDGEIVHFESVFVDFGNSGVIGFGGEHKDKSLGRANTEAKSKTPTAKDFDVTLRLSEEEVALLEKIKSSINETANKTISEKLRRDLPTEYLVTLEQEISEAQKIMAMNEIVQNRYIAKSFDDPTNVLFYLPEPSEKEAELMLSIRFKTSHHINPEHASIYPYPGLELLSFHDLPRNIPFAWLLHEAVKEKVASLEHEAMAMVERIESDERPEEEVAVADGLQ
jgi:hypothetical protein